MAVVEVTHLTIDKGTDFEIEFDLTEDDGSPLNLTGYVGNAKIRKYPTSPTYKPFTITFISRLQGRIKLSLSNSQTAGLFSGRNYYDLLLTDGFGKIRKVLEGTMIVNESTTVGYIDSDNLEGLGDIDLTNINDGYVLMYLEDQKKYAFVDPDMVLTKSVTTDDDLPDVFVEKLDSDLDDRVDVDSGEF